MSNKTEQKFNNGLEEHDGFGFYQWINFGSKYKKKSVYDVANLGDYGYLKWLVKSQNNKNNQFKLSQTFLPHLKAALNTADTVFKWQKKDMQINDNGFFDVYYEAFDPQGNARQKGPNIPMFKCKKCKKNKNKNLIRLDNLFDGQCNDCANVNNKSSYNDYFHYN